MNAFAAAPCQGNLDYRNSALCGIYSCSAPEGLAGECIRHAEGPSMNSSSRTNELPRHRDFTRAKRDSTVVRCAARERNGSSHWLRHLRSHFGSFPGGTTCKKSYLRLLSLGLSSSPCCVHPMLTPRRRGRGFLDSGMMLIHAAERIFVCAGGRPCQRCSVSKYVSGYRCEPGGIEWCHRSLLFK